MAIKRVMVIGAGQMGSGIAQVCARGGYDVVLNDVKQEFAEKGLASITKNIARSVDKRKNDRGGERRGSLPSHVINKS